MTTLKVFKFKSIIIKNYNDLLPLTKKTRPSAKIGVFLIIRGGVVEFEGLVLISYEDL